MAGRRAAGAALVAPSRTCAVRTGQRVGRAYGKDNFLNDGAITDELLPDLMALVDAPAALAKRRGAHEVRPSKAAA